MIIANSARSGKCRVCGRVLKNPRHQAVGIGPVCARKELARMISDYQQPIAPQSAIAKEPEAA